MVKVSVLVLPTGRYVNACGSLGNGVAGWSHEWKVRTDGTALDALGQLIAEREADLANRARRLQHMRDAYAAMVK